MSPKPPFNEIPGAERSKLNAYQIRIFLICALVVVLDGFDSQAIGMVAPDLARSMHLTATELGWAFSAAQIGGTLGSLAFGPLADRFGRRPLTALALIVVAVFTYLTAVSGSVGILLFTRFCAGVGLAGVIPCILALGSEYAPKRLRATVISFIWAGYPLGGAISGFVSAYLVEHSGWESVFIVGTVLPIFVLVLVAVGLPESLQFMLARQGRTPRVDAILRRLGSDMLPSGAAATPRTTKASVPVKLLFSDGRAWPTLLVWLLFFSVFATTKINVVWLPSLLKLGGISTSSAAFAMGFKNIGSVCGMLTVGFVLDRIGPTRTLLPALGISIVLMALLAVVPSNLTAVTITVTLIGFFVGYCASGTQAYAAVLYPTEVRSTGIGWGVAWSRLGQAVAPVAVGTLINQQWTLTNIYVVIALLPLLSGATVLLLRITPQAESDAQVSTR